MRKKFLVLLKKDPIQILRRYEAESQYQEREYGLRESVLIRKACSSWQREGRENSFMGLFAHTRKQSMPMAR